MNALWQGFSHWPADQIHGDTVQTRWKQLTRQLKGSARSMLRTPCRQQSETWERGREINRVDAGETMTRSERQKKKDTEEQMERLSSRQTVNEMKSPVLKCTTPPGDTTTGSSDWCTQKIFQWTCHSVKPNPVLGKVTKHADRRLRDGSSTQTESKSDRGERGENAGEEREGGGPVTEVGRG